MSNRETFLSNINVNPDREKNRIIELQKKFESGEITENDISEEDMTLLINLYEEQIKEIKDDTNNIKNRIKRKLELLKK